VTHRDLEVIASQIAGDHVGERRLVVDHQGAVTGGRAAPSGPRYDLHLFIVPCGLATQPF
jgi:hypothetical protein